MKKKEFIKFLENANMRNGDFMVEWGEELLAKKLLKIFKPVKSLKERKPK